MIEFKKEWVKILAFVVLLAGSISLVVIQVNGAQTATKLESTLISSLQFVLSIGFTWLLSMVVFEGNQRERQKKFAIAAFRRIKEIDRNIKRTHEYVNSCLCGEGDPSACLKVVHANLINAQDTVTSSIADWADVIEDEIELAQQLENLELRQSKAEVAMGNGITEKKIEQHIEQQINTLSKRLPPSLRHTVKQERSQEEMTSDAVGYLAKEIMRNKSLDLYAFWGPDEDFMKEVSTLSVGDEVFIARGATSTRSSPILVYDKDHNSIGVVINRCVGHFKCSYASFVHAMDVILGMRLTNVLAGNLIKAKIVRIGEYEPDLKRTYFDLKLEQDVTAITTAKPD